MYNLLITAEDGAWEERSYAYRKSRFGEYTAEAIRARFEPLNRSATEELESFPALLAYESMVGRPAQLARITRIRISAGDRLGFAFEVVPGVESIPPAVLEDMAWDLDIHEWELNRTHWAIKDVNLLEILEETGLEGIESAQHQFSGAEVLNDRDELTVAPRVFRVPGVQCVPGLVSVMMPIRAEFDQVYRAVESACTAVGATCKRADDVWEESTIIQDVFNLIYQSEVVIVDLSGRNSNVLYETGVAHTLGRPVVPISQEVDDLPFDLMHHRVLHYLRNEEGLQEMKENLVRRLRRVLA